MTEIIENSVANFYNSYLFDKAWNLPAYEYRRNIEPIALTNAIATSRIQLERKIIALPTELDPYQVYKIPKVLLGGIRTEQYTDWTTASDILVDRLEFRVHDIDGIWFPRNEIFFIHDTDDDSLLMALKRTIFIDIYSLAHPIEDIYIATYFDSDIANVVTVTNAVVGDGSSTASLFAESQLANWTFINGRYTTITQLSDLQVVGDYVEIVTDQNIIGSFTVDLADLSERRNFISDIDNRSRSIIHIPKALNPTNKVISHHTVDVFVLPRNTADARMNGRFVHRAIEPYYFSQITHNDFSIPDDILNAYTASLNAFELKLEIHIRTHDRDNELIREKNYIDLLYRHTDDEIMDFFEEVGLAPFEFWSAKNLEASQYTRFISDVPMPIAASTIGTYIDALGYYEAVNLISPRVIRFKSDDPKYSAGPQSGDGAFKIPLPLVFNTLRIFATIFVNGKKVHNDNYSILVTNGAIIVDPDVTIVIPVSADITIELFEFVPDNLAKIVPVTALHQIDIVDLDFVLYEVFVRNIPTQGVKTSYDRTYVELTDYSALADLVDLQGQQTLVFKPSAFDREFVVAYDIGFRHQEFDIDSLLGSNDTVVIDLNTKVTGFVTEELFALDTHTGPVASTGTLLDPMDPSAVIAQPAWHVLDRDLTFGTTSRWASSVPPLGLSAKYTLDNSIQSTYYIIGYKLGTLVDPNDVNRVINMPTHFELLVDGNVVHTRTGEIWFGNPNPDHTFMLDNPVLVDNEIELHVSIKPDGFSNFVEIDTWEPIFGFQTFESSVPYIGSFQTIAYLNGYELIEGLDFNIVSTDDPAILNGDPHVVGTEFVLTNVSYLIPSGNKLELINVRDKTFDSGTKYLSSEIITDMTDNPYWFDNLSTLSVDGKSIENISTEFGEVKVSLTDNRPGAVVHTRTLIPNISQKVLEQYRTSVDDDDILTRLVAYFGELNPVGPPILLLPFSHRIISLYIATIVKAALDGVIDLTFDPNLNSMSAVIADYEYLKDLDLVFKVDSDIDLEFVDIQPAFVDAIVTGSSLYLAINSLIDQTITDTTNHRRYDQIDILP